MFEFSFCTKSKAVIEGANVSLRYPEMSDYPQWSLLREQSAQFLQPWEPRWSHNDLSKFAFRLRLRRYVAEKNAGSGHALFLTRQSDNVLLGGITLGHIRKGVSHSAQIGYWIGERFARQGYMREGLELLCQFAFSHHGLHRLEAACIPSNIASIGLLEKAGFAREGKLRSYLKINGTWQDHILFSRINPLHTTIAPSVTFRSGDQ